MKRTALMKRRTPLNRGSWLRRRHRAKPITDTSAEIWREGLGSCVVCPAEGSRCGGPVQGHHIIARQTLRRLGLLEFLMDKRNRLAVCEYRHEQHTTGYKPIPRSVLPDSVFEFAFQQGLLWYLDRHYPPSKVAAA